MNKKAFILIDSLITISLMINLVLVIISFYQIYEKYKASEIIIEENMNERINEILNNTYVCGACEINDIS